jgi:tRNA (guanine37-N1)-methyltransferase
LIFHILTLFPEVFKPYINTSIIGRSIEKGDIKAHLINFRDFSKNKHKKVDDTIYGGGPGMLLQCEPIYNAITSIKKDNSKLIFLTPEGKLFNQKVAKRLSKEKEIILVCGHYEGFDNRIFNFFDHEKISIGDYILTGGELPALVIFDCVVRLYNKVLNNPDSLLEESFNDGLIEYDQYTRPAEYLNQNVPKTLLSGDHKRIEMWKKQKSLVNTLKYRPDLFEQKLLTKENIELLISYFEEKQNDN